VWVLEEQTSPRSRLMIRGSVAWPTEGGRHDQAGRNGAPGRPAASVGGTPVTDAQRLAVVRIIHTEIYVVMAVSTVGVLVAGVFGLSGPWLWAAVILVTIEAVVFVGNGMRCPLTALAEKYGAESGYAFDTLLPESITRHTPSGSSARCWRSECSCFLRAVSRPSADRQSHVSEIRSVSSLDLRTTSANGMDLLS